MSHFVVLAELTIEPAKRVAFDSELKALATASRQEAGCLSYEVFQHGSDPTRALIYEKWSSRSSWNAHLNTDHLRIFKSIAIPDLATWSVEKMAVESPEN